MSGQIKKVLGWSVAQVEAWLRRVGLSDVVGAFRAASLDGTALLELAPATMRSTLRIHDEGTLLRICEALEPLKEQWRQHRVAHGMPPSPTAKGADRALKPWGYGGDRGAKLYDHSGPEYSDRDGDARIPDRRRRPGKAAGELVVTLGAVTELPPSAAGAYVVLELDGERTKSAALPIADEIEGSGVPVELQSFSLPVTAAADRGVLARDDRLDADVRRALARPHEARRRRVQAARLPRDRRARPRRGAMGRRARGGAGAVVQARRK